MNQQKRVIGMSWQMDFLLSSFNAGRGYKVMVYRLSCKTTLVSDICNLDWPVSYVGTGWGGPPFHVPTLRATPFPRSKDALWNSDGQIMLCSLPMGWVHLSHFRWVTYFVPFTIQKYSFGCEKRLGCKYDWMPITFLWLVTFFDRRTWLYTIESNYYRFQQCQAEKYRFHSVVYYYFFTFKLRRKLEKTQTAHRKYIFNVCWELAKQEESKRIFSLSH